MDMQIHLIVEVDEDSAELVIDQLREIAADYKAFPLRPAVSDIFVADGEGLVLRP